MQCLNCKFHQTTNLRRFKHIFFDNQWKTNIEIAHGKQLRCYLLKALLPKVNYSILREQLVSRKGEGIDYEWEGRANFIILSVADNFLYNETICVRVIPNSDWSKLELQVPTRPNVVKLVLKIDLLKANTGVQNLIYILLTCMYITDKGVDQKQVREAVKQRSYAVRGYGKEAEGLETSWLVGIH